MTSSDQQFYANRATDVQDAVDGGAIETAAALVAHTLIEEGPAGLGHLTQALNANNQ